MTEAPDRIPSTAANAAPRGSSKSTWAARNARGLLLVALVALGVHDIFGAHGFIAMRRTQQEIAQTQDEISKLDDENRTLADQVGALKSDPRMIERIAREEMGLARPGEVIFKVPADSAPTGSAAGDGSAPANAASTPPQR